MSLHVIWGPMFSKKTHCLLFRYGIYKQKGLICRLFTYKKDARYGTDVVSTHKDTLGNQTQVTSITCSDLMDYYSLLMEADVIAIDEIQFFPGTTVQVIRELVSRGKKVLVCGLDSDFEQKPFPNSPLPDLIPLALTVEKLYAICDFCPEGGKFHKAPMSWRTTSNKETVLIGGSGDYGAICHRCLNKPEKVRRIVKLADST